MSSLSFLHGIFPTQGSNPGLLHCRQILYQVSHQGTPKILEWVAYPFSRGSSWPRNWTEISCIAGGFFTIWATREASLLLEFSNSGNGTTAQSALHTRSRGVILASYPFPSPHIQSENFYSWSIHFFLLCVLSHSVMVDSLWPHGLWPARLLCPRNSPCKDTGVGSHSVLQGIFPTQGCLDLQLRAVFSNAVSKHFGTRSHAESGQWFQQCHLEAILSYASCVSAQSHHPALKGPEGLQPRVSLAQVPESSCWLTWNLLVRSDLLPWLECKHLLELSFVSHVSFIIAFCVYKHVSSMREKCDNL